MDADIDRLVAQCKSNDVDARIDAVARLQAACEAGAEITDPDAVVAVVRTCLRTPNQHLTTATLTALPALIPLLTARSAAGTASPAASTSSAAGAPTDVPALRQLLQALLPPGGVIDRLGDSRERARVLARDVLVLLAGLAFAAAPSAQAQALARSRDAKGPETPLALFERLFKDGALASKVWRVREQAMLTLVHVRRAHHLFPIRAYLAPLVDALEDTDGNVRECARHAVVELFTGPAVSDAARADLKKEMARKGVRKNIVDGVLAKVLAGSAGGRMTPTELGADPAEPYVPPSIALGGRRAPLASSTPVPGVRAASATVPRPASRAAGALSPVLGDPLTPGTTGADVRPVYIASVRDLENEFAAMVKPFEGRESEHNWAAREQAVMRVRGMLKGEVHERFTETFLAGLKQGFIDMSLKTLHSLRTTVASNTCSLYAELAVALGTALDPNCDALFTNLLRMASLTKKITAQQSQATVATLLAHTSAHPRVILPILWNSLQDKAIQTRVYVVGHVKMYLEYHAQRSRHVIESAGGVEILEKCIRKALADANPGVRDNARRCFWVFEGVWRDRGRAMLESLDSMSRKQLEKACPHPDAIATFPGAAPATPAPKKSSVAAAIAASRAKAKAIATAPPSLRHQATATSHSSKRAPSPSLSTGSSTGAGPMSLSFPTSRSASASTSSPPRMRVTSVTLGRSTSVKVLPNARARTMSSRSPPSSPPSPTPDHSSHRRISSPLGPAAAAASPGGSAFRRAVQTALPASPPSTQRPVRAAPVPFPRESMSMSLAGMHGAADQSLLLATAIPIPEDTDSDVDMDVDESVNLMSFSSPFEVYPPMPDPAPVPVPAAGSPFFTPRPGGGRAQAYSAPQPMVEDAMRARAEQAESAAERLLELVEPEEDSAHPSPIPASLLVRSRETTPKPAAAAGTSDAKITVGLPKTPVGKNAAIMRQAALFQNSPAYRGGAATSLFDMVNGRNSTSQWWLKRTSLIDQGNPLRVPDRSECIVELKEHISALEQGSMDVRALQKLALLCRENPVRESVSPTSPAHPAPLSPSPLFGTLHSLPSVLRVDIWTQDKNFDRLFGALIKFLDPGRASEELEFGLIVLWEILEHQAPFLEGRETDIFGVLLQVRYCAQINVLQATNTFRDVLTSRIEPVYGLTTMHASLRAFRETPVPPASSAEVKDTTYAFGLIALSKFILRLPAEILEDELPRLRLTLISALTDLSSNSSLVVREAAAAAIIAAQLVLRDETHLFALLDGLPDDKKNLLTYLFDKHGSRDAPEDAGPSGLEKLEKEMRRLDNRTSTPPRPSPQPVAV